MLEIICVVAAVIWFGKTAKEYNGNILLWCAVAVISIYLPMFLMDRIIYPSIIKWLHVYVDIMVQFVGIVLNLAAALLGFLSGKRILHYFLKVDEY